MTYDDAITEISLAQLHESPFNPRKTFLDVEQLADSIKAEGRIHQPLLVRSRVIDLAAPNPEDMFDGYEVVFGHRRLRAAALAGLKTVPCMVRSMTDAQARSAQIAENLSRTDVHPIEEAEGFAAMLEHDGISADDLATQVGKSRSYVYGRLKLLQAVPEVRQACVQGEVGSEVALLIARLRTPKLQKSALSAIRGKYIDMKDGGAKSFRAIRGLLNELFTLELKSAIFEPTDATLLPGAGDCRSCPKLAGNAPEYSDVAAQKHGGYHEDDAEGLHQAYLRRVKHGGTDVCTDPDCWAAKKTAHLARQAAKLQADGLTVVAGNKARAAISATGEVKGDYIDLAKVKAALKKVAKKGEPAPQPVHIQDPRTGSVVQAYRRADLVAAGLQGVAKQPAAARGEAQRESDWKREREEREARAKAENARRLAVLARVREVAATRSRTVEELRLIAEAAVRGVNWAARPLLLQLHGVARDDEDEDLAGPIASYTADQLALLLLDCALVQGLRADGHEREDAPENLMRLATAYGLDVKAIHREASGAVADQRTGDLLEEAQDEEVEA